MKSMHLSETKLHTNTDEFEYNFEISKGAKENRAFSFSHERHFHFAGKKIPVDLEISKETEIK